MIKKTALNKVKSDKFNNANTNLAAQRNRLLNALRAAGSYGITTVQARHELNIMAPAPRIFELRHVFRKNIQMIWTVETTPEGYTHRCARYVLLPGVWKEARCA